MEKTNLKIPVIYEDDSIIVIDKPALLVVNKSATVEGITLQDWLKEKDWLKKDKTKAEKGYQRFLTDSGMVHRLDKEASGLMVVTKTPEAFLSLLDQFKERKVKKSYLVLVHGKVAPEEKTINGRIGRKQNDRRKHGIVSYGVTAETRLEPVSYLQDPKEKNRSKKYFTLLRVRPQTGRTHQVRVHLLSIRHPLVSDRLYAGKKTSRADHRWCSRLFLHAESLEFIHPITKKIVKFFSPLPSDLSTALAKRQKIEITS